MYMRHSNALRPWSLRSSERASGRAARRIPPTTGYLGIDRQLVTFTKERIYTAARDPRRGFERPGETASCTLIVRIANETRAMQRYRSSRSRLNSNLYSGHSPSLSLSLSLVNAMNTLSSVNIIPLRSAGLRAISWKRGLSARN